MGSRGPLPKPAVKQQGRRPTEVVRLVPREEQIKVPEPPEGLLPTSQEAWAVYWASPVSSVAAEVDLPAISRLFRLRDQWERAMDMVRQGVAVRGSTGQIRVNPLAGYAAQVETSIIRLENELGLTPLSRARLGISIGEAHKTLEEMNRRFNDDFDANPRDEDDPAAALLQSGADGRRSATAVTRGEGGEVGRGERPAGAG